MERDKRISDYLDKRSGKWMNPREEAVAQKYEDAGWRVLRGGAPDFLMLKVQDGEVQDVKAVEVKSPSSDLSYEQSVYRMILEKAGFDYTVEVVK